jgi:hypothetical protein
MARQRKIKNGVWMNGRMDRVMNGRSDEWIDGRMGGNTKLNGDP